MPSGELRSILKSNLSLVATPSQHNSNKENYATDLLVIHSVSKLIAQSQDSGTLIPGILRIMSEMLGLNRGRVLIPDGNKLQIQHSYGLTRAEHQRGQYHLGEGVSGRVMESGQIAVVQDIDDEPDMLFRAVDRTTLPPETVSFIAVPIIEAGQRIGVLGCHRLRNRLRSLDTDLVVLKIVATFLAKILAQDTLSSAPNPDSKTTPNFADRTDYKILGQPIIGRSPALQQALEQTRHVAATDVTVLLTGESGTGKELFARLLHDDSEREAQPFVAINCAAIPEQLLESELFGHERGAFTGAVSAKKGKIELAAGGTLFLDEIGDLSLELQAKLLRVLETKSVQRVGAQKSTAVDVRIVAATHKDLMQAVNQGLFRLDLFYRLNVFPLQLPALRHRRGDISLLGQHFLARLNSRFNRSVIFAQGVSDRLESYNWPGNIRQLENVLTRALLLAQQQAISVRVIEKILADESRIHQSTELSQPFSISEDQPTVEAEKMPSNGTESPLTHSASEPSSRTDAELESDADNRVMARHYSWVNEDEREAIERALQEAKGNKTQAAAIVGMTPRQLRYRMKKLGL